MLSFIYNQRNKSQFNNRISTHICENCLYPKKVKNIKCWPGRLSKKEPMHDIGLDPSLLIIVWRINKMFTQPLILGSMELSYLWLWVDCLYHIRKFSFYAEFIEEKYAQMGLGD